MNTFELLFRHIVLKFDLIDIEEKTFDALGWWVFDAMGGIDLDDCGWWKALDEWRVGSTEWKQQAADEFLVELMTVFDERITAFGKGSTKANALRQMILGLTEETRFQMEGYFQFIESLQHTIWLRVPVICFVGGHASGDMFGIGASALLKKNLGIVVYEFTDKGQDHSAGMKSFFDLVAENRVKLAASLKDCLSTTNANGVYQLMETMKSFCWLAGYNLGTYFLMDKFTTELGSENRRIVRAGFKVDAAIEPKVKEFLEMKTLPLTTLCKRKVVVLWSRFTGKKGEYHPEHDTSFTGIAQLAWLATELGCYVIFAGDKPVIHRKVENRDEHEGHFDAICSAIEVRFGEKRCFNMTEFWNEKTWTALKPNRVTQYQVYELLHRECDVRHLGMRSGNMEALALLSYFVRYMEENYSWGGKRMMAWHGKGIGYERILLKEPPTRVGKYLHYDQKLNRHGLNKAGVSQAFVPPYIKERNRGLPNTSSKNQETVEEEFARKRRQIKERFKYAPQKAMFSAFDQLDPEREKREKALEKAMAKPLGVAHWYTGFDFGDLMKIVMFFQELNPHRPKTVTVAIRNIWSDTPYLSELATRLGDQAPILFEMRSLLVEMGVIQAVSKSA